MNAVVVASFEIAVDVAVAVAAAHVIGIRDVEAVADGVASIVGDVEPKNGKGEKLACLLAFFLAGSLARLLTCLLLISHR